jgi:hypothetical protein
VQLGDRGDQLVEEDVADALVAAERMAGHERVHESRFADAADEPRHAGHVREQRVQPHLAIAEEAADPGSGCGKDGVDAADFQHGQAAGAFVEAGGREEVVLERFDKAPGPPHFTDSGSRPPGRA